jgi:hypothetical protein
MKLLLTAVLITSVATPTVFAHHVGWGAATKSPRCGWLEGDNVRDLANLSTFCAHSIPAALRVQGVTANRERLWIDAPPELAAALRDHDTRTETLLKDWLQMWRTITGYRTAFVIVLRGHAEIARAGTAMSGDFVTVR